MNASNRNQEQYPWWEGNARFMDLSNTFIVAHLAHAALIMLWAGVFTLFEIAVYLPDEPFYTQGLILLPHLAAEGWGLGPGGVVDTSVWSAIAIIHIVSAVVLVVGAYFHRTRLPANLAIVYNYASKYHFEWQDARKMGIILGHHLIFLGLGALLFVIKAQFFGGLYDATVGEVRLVPSPTLDPGTIWAYRTHLFSVDSLEDLVGGHIYIAGLLIFGGVWHILVAPYEWVKRLFIFSGDGILSYSLMGIALGGFAASYYCGFDTLSYPEKFYGPALELKSAFLPRYFEVQPSLTDGYTSRVWLANAHFYLAFFFLQGGLWHYQRAMGFRVSRLFETWRQNIEVSSDNPSLVYQAQIQIHPHAWPELQYEVPQVESPFGRKRADSSEENLYRPCQGIKRTQIGTVNGIAQTLYQTTYQLQETKIYHPPTYNREVGEDQLGDSRDYGKWLYELPRNMAKAFEYGQPLESVFYEPKAVARTQASGKKAN